MPFAETIDFALLYSSEAFADFSATVRELLGLPVALYPPDSLECKSLFRNSEMSPLCLLIRSHPDGLHCCQADEQARFARAIATRRGLHARCHAGLIDVAVPIFHRGAVVAVLSCGQVLPTPPSEAGLDAFCAVNARFGWAPDALRAAYFHAPYLEREKIVAGLKLMNLFAEHLCEMAHLRFAWEASSGRQLITQALAFMQEHLGERLTLAQVAAHVHCSPGHFCKRFHQVLGISFMGYLQQKRVEAAQEHLRRTALPITAIAFESGFNSLSQFNRTFKKMTGHSPRSYRESFRATID
ncbi:MAG TPA: helix-turn-helix domain-containing protein [Armatimonadota bacterium]|jgi:AraC-like DNA-binding protein/ligand-binding sensor protein